MSQDKDTPREALAAAANRLLHESITPGDYAWLRDEIEMVARAAIADVPAVQMRPMEFEDGRKGWYVDHPEFYADIEPNTEGQWTVFFKDRNGGEGYGERASPPQAPQPPRDDTLREIAATLNRMAGSATARVDTSGDVVGYVIKTGAFHRLIGYMQNLRHPVNLPRNMAEEPASQPEPPQAPQPVFTDEYLLRVFPTFTHDAASGAALVRLGDAVAVAKALCAAAHLGETK